MFQIDWRFWRQGINGSNWLLGPFSNYVRSSIEPSGTETYRLVSVEWLRSAGRSSSRSRTRPRWTSCTRPTEGILGCRCVFSCKWEKKKEKQVKAPVMQTAREWIMRRVNKNVNGRKRWAMLTLLGRLEADRVDGEAVGRSCVVQCERWLFIYYNAAVDFHRWTLLVSCV